MMQTGWVFGSFMLASVALALLVFPHWRQALALRYAQANSLVGYEPSMEYVFCESTAAYKEALTKQSLRRLAAAQRRREAARRAKNK